MYFHSSEINHTNGAHRCILDSTPHQQVLQSIQYTIIQVVTSYGKTSRQKSLGTDLDRVIVLLTPQQRHGYPLINQQYCSILSTSLLKGHWKPASYKLITSLPNKPFQGLQHPLKINALCWPQTCSKHAQS